MQLVRRESSAVATKLAPLVLITVQDFWSIFVLELTSMLTLLPSAFVLILSQQPGHRHRWKWSNSRFPPLLSSIPQPNYAYCGQCQRYPNPQANAHTGRYIAVSGRIR